MNPNKKYLIKRKTFYLVLLNIILCIASLGAYLAPYVQPIEVPIITLFGLSYSVQLMVHLIFVLIWLATKRKFFWLSLSFLILELFVVKAVVSIHPFLETKELDNAIVIGNYNMQFSMLVYNGAVSKKDFTDFLKDQNEIDVITLQEVGRTSKNFISQAMKFEFEYHPANSRVIILSKYPIVDSGELKHWFSGANNCIWADIAIDADTIRVYAVHLESNRYDGVIPTVIHETGEEELSNKVMLGLIKNYPLFSQKRSDQAYEIARHSSSCPYPVIIAGDFNDVPLSHVYSLLSSEHPDSFKSGGNGIGATLNSSVPGLRIDYILSSPSLKSVAHQVIRVPFSDHYFQKARLRME